MKGSLAKFINGPTIPTLFVSFGALSYWYFRETFGLSVERWLSLVVALLVTVASLFLGVVSFLAAMAFVAKDLTTQEQGKIDEPKIGDPSSTNADGNQTIEALGE